MPWAPRAGSKETKGGFPEVAPECQWRQGEVWTHGGGRRRGPYQACLVEESSLGLSLAFPLMPPSLSPSSPCPSSSLASFPKSEQSSAELSRVFCSLGAHTEVGGVCKGHTVAELTSRGHPVTGGQEGVNTGKKGHKVTGGQGRTESWADVYELEKDK